MIDKYEYENDVLIKNFLNKYVFSSWKNQKWAEDENIIDNKYHTIFKGLELQINAVCNLECVYCYYNKNKEKLYPASISSQNLILKNLGMVLSWLDKNKYYPEIELFSGEIFSQAIGIIVLEKIIDWQIKNNLTTIIKIPTNFSFVMDDTKTLEIIKLIERAKQHNIHISLSASVDGKYCDINRPFKNGWERTDEYYHRVFRIGELTKTGFHPMIYSEGIEHWKDNFLWFQEMFEKYGIDWKNIYLLEVRNEEWNKTQLQHFYDFIRFVVRYAYKKSEVIPNEFPMFAHKHKLFNIFSMFSTLYKGVGCSIQTTTGLRLGDLTATACHRQAYPSHNLWRFIVKDNEIVDIKTLNHGMFLAIASCESDSMPVCQSCFLRKFCAGQCLGAMLETNYESFLPISTVCALEHTKVKAILDELERLGLTEHFCNFIHPNKVSTVKIYHEYFKKGAV